MLDLSNRSFTKWFCKQIQELEMNEQQIITLPFRPRNDEQIVIYMEQRGEVVRVHDEGETLGHVFMDSSMDIGDQSDTQKDYLRHLATLHGVKSEGLEFYIECQRDDVDFNQKILSLIQFIVQISSIDALQEPPRETAFARQVYNKIKPRIQGRLQYGRYLDYGCKRHPEDRSTRKVDFFKENGNYILGRALFSKVNFDKVLTTWNIIEEIEEGRVPSFAIHPGEKKIKKATICHPDFDDDVYIEMLEKKGKVFYFPKEQDKIIDFFNS